MRAKLGVICILVFSLLAIGATAFGQASSENQQAIGSNESVQKHKGKKAGPGRETAQGGEDIGKGVGKGAVSAGKGAGGAASDLATLHPLDAGASLGKGAAGAGKDVGVGSVKGSAKIGKGIGSWLGKLGKKAVGKSNKKKDG
jgi:hypothetical protein